jgi:hypothetical protein
VSETGKTENVCRRCGEAKTAFPWNLRLTAGLSSWCRDCHAEAKRRYRDENRERLNESRRVVPAWVYVDGRRIRNPSPRAKSKVR